MHERKPADHWMVNRGLCGGVGREGLFLFCFLGGFILCGGDVIDHFLNDHLLDVDVEAHQADKAEAL